MKSSAALLAALALGGLLAACGPTPPAPAPPTPAPAAPGPAANEQPMAPMPAEASPVSAHGSGTVTAVDMAAGTVSIDHGAIPEANWPPMLMTFKASPGLLTGISVGDHVEFDVRIQGGASEVTALRKK